MNTTELKIYLKSNPTSNSKLNNNVLNYIILYSLLLQKRERERGREREKMNPTQLNQLNSIRKQNHKIQKYENKNSRKGKQK